MYKQYGYTKELLKTVTLSGQEGAEKIKAIMENLRENPPAEIWGDTVIAVKDYSKGIDGMPKANVLKFLAKNSWMAVRPSGTEPKIKYYFGVSGEKSKVDSVLERMKNLTCPVTSFPVSFFI